ncbi:MAG: insulinase family protein [Calditrichales bacterium]|nr:insulinase family protein [Calditrichales bacterium]
MKIDLNSTIQKTVLDNGLTVVSEHIPSVRSLSLGVWVKAGSRYESAQNNGVAHFLEHIFFKGTKKRSALKIAQSLEELGGSLNAYTSKELTVFYTHSLDSHLSVSMNVLADMLCNSLFRKHDIENERQVIFEEINSAKDTPDEYIFDVFQEKLFPDQPIGYPILGTKDTVKKFGRSMLIDFWMRFYNLNNIVISAAGNVNHEKLVKLASDQFHFQSGRFEVELSQPKAAEKIDIEFKEPVNQSHICIGLEGLSYMTEDRYKLIALNSYLGGGMSSKLFQVIREKHGLAYTVYSSLDFFKDTGMISFYLGTDKRNQKRAIKILFNEIEKLTQKEISNSAVHKIKKQLKGSFILGLESANRRMTRLAKNEIYYKRQITLNELLEKIDSITSASLLDIAQKLFIMDKFNIIRLSPNN